MASEKAQKPSTGHQETTGTKETAEKSFAQKDKEAKEQGINVVFGAPANPPPVIDNLEERSGATGTGKGGKARSGQEDADDVGGAPEGGGQSGISNFFK